MMIKSKRLLFYRIDKAISYLNTVIIFVTFGLAFFWIVLDKSDLEAWIALLAITSIILSRMPIVFKKLGYDTYPLGKGVISKGGCWIAEGKEEFKIKLTQKVDRFKTKIDYIPTERVMAHFSDDHLVFKRREGDSGYKLRVDYELIKKD